MKANTTASQKRTLNLGSISAEVAELIQCETISSQLPVHFENSTFSIRELGGACPQCEQPIPDDLFRGRVSTHFRDVAVVSAVGICPDCCLASSFAMRFRPDGSHQMRGPDGLWHQVSVEKSSPMENFATKATSTIRRFFTKG